MSRRSAISTIAGQLSRVISSIEATGPWVLMRGSEQMREARNKRDLLAAETSSARDIVKLRLFITYLKTLRGFQCIKNVATNQRFIGRIFVYSLDCALEPA